MVFSRVIRTFVWYVSYTCTYVCMCVASIRNMWDRLRKNARDSILVCVCVCVKRHNVLQRDNDDEERRRRRWRCTLTRMALWISRQLATNITSLSTHAYHLYTKSQSFVGRTCILPDYALSLSPLPCCTTGKHSTNERATSISNIIRSE